MLLVCSSLTSLVYNKMADWKAMGHGSHNKVQIGAILSKFCFEATGFVLTYLNDNRRAGNLSCIYYLLAFIVPFRAAVDCAGLSDCLCSAHLPVSSRVHNMNV